MILMPDSSMILNARQNRKQQIMRDITATGTITVAGADNEKSETRPSNTKNTTEPTLTEPSSAFVSFILH